MTMFVYSGSSSGQAPGARKRLALTAAFVLACSLLTGCAAPDHVDHAKTRSDQFRTSRGVIVDVPSVEGAPRYNRNAADLAKQIKQLDGTLESWRLSLASADPAVGAEVARVVMEARDAAIEDLALAYRIAGQTSGLLDSRIIAGAREGIRDLQSAMTAPATSYKLNVRTSISANVDASIDFVSAAEAAQAAHPAWQPYSGQPLRIGRYVFRVVPLERSQPAFKSPPILIMRDPFALELRRAEL